MVRWLFIGCLLGTFFANIPLLSQTQSEADIMNTNASLFRLGISRITNSIVDKSPFLRGSSVLLSIKQSEDQALIEQAVITGLTKNGVSVYLDPAKDSSAFAVTFNAVDLQVMYGEPFHAVLFGESLAQRLVTTSIPYTLVERKSGKVILSETLQETSSDTVSIGEISGLEQQLIPSTVAPLPERSFFDKVLEPLLIIGSTGVAIFLFFHIRS